MAIKHRYKIAALFNEFIFLSSRQTFEGISEAVKEFDIDLTVIMCGDLKNPDPIIGMRNILYKLINPDSFDGFIIPFSGLSQQVSKDEFRDVMKDVFAKPCILLSAEEEDMTCIMPDYSQGIRDLSMHLIECHKIERFIFLRGPSNHIASNVRERGFNAAAEKLGLSVLNLEIIKTNFDTELAVGIVDELEKKEFIRPDTALISVSENMAIATILELQIRGYRIPEDFIVCGTSGTPESNCFRPSITTVENNFDMIGHKAVELLVDAFENGKKPGVIYFSVAIVTRQSCGCIAMDYLEKINGEEIIKLGNNFKDKNSEVKPQPELLNLVKKSFPLELEAFFFQALEYYLQSLNSHINQRSEYALFNHLNLFRQIGYNLISDFNLPDLFSRLKDRLGIHNCFLSAYCTPDQSIEKLQLLQAFLNGKAVLVDKENVVFDSKDFFPQMLRPDKRSTFIVEPLFYQNQHLGILVIEEGKSNVLVLEALSAQIAGAFNNYIQREKITALALNDSLTGLPNRRLFDDSLEVITGQCIRNNLAFGIMFIDLDNFKNVNDTLGHEVGDELLVLVSDIIGSCIRKGDTVARLGGDEFALILPDMQNRETISIIAERIIDNFQKQLSGNPSFKIVTPSIGISLFPDHGKNAADLLKKADIAMYSAKKRGKNNFVIYNE